MTLDDAIKLFRDLPQMLGIETERVLRMREDGKYVVEVRCTERRLRELTDLLERHQRAPNVDERVYDGELIV